MFLLRHLRKGLRHYEACYKTSEDFQAGLAAVCIYADPADMGNHFFATRLCSERRLRSVSINHVWAYGTVRG